MCAPRRLTALAAGRRRFRTPRPISVRPRGKGCGGPSCGHPCSLRRPRRIRCWVSQARGRPARPCSCVRAELPAAVRTDGSVEHSLCSLSAQQWAGTGATGASWYGRSSASPVEAARSARHRQRCARGKQHACRTAQNDAAARHDPAKPHVTTSGSTSRPAQPNSSCPAPNGSEASGRIICPGTSRVSNNRDLETPHGGWVGTEDAGFFRSCAWRAAHRPLRRQTAGDPCAFIHRGRFRTGGRSISQGRRRGHVEAR